MTIKKDPRRALLNELGYNEIVVDLAVKANQLKALNFPQAAKQVEIACKDLHNLKEEYLSGKLQSGEDFLNRALLNYKNLKSGSLKDNKIMIEVTGIINNLINRIKNLFGQKNQISKSMDEITRDLSKTLNYSKNFTMFKPESKKESIKEEKKLDDPEEPSRYLDVD